MSPCPTFYNTYDPWKESFVPLPEDWDTTDRIKAIDLTMEEANEGMFHSGIFYQEQRPSYMDKVHSVFSKAHGDQISSIEDLMDQYV